MELNSELIAIQGLLKSIIKTTGDFRKIKYKGGNEMKINSVITELKDYLTSKGYINKHTPKKEFNKELDDVTLFLVINLDFKDKSMINIKEFAHLINAIPTLSKCLMANIIVEIGLNEHYCNALHKLPAELSEELLSEIVPCIKKCKANVFSELTYVYLKNIIRKISSMDSSDSKMVMCIEQLEEISTQILLNCSGINLELTHGWNKLQLYQHMGQTLLCLLKLLQYCQVDNEVLYKIIDDLINTICCVTNAVTVDVYCSWAELENNGEILQTVIAEQAYHVVEKFQKYTPAKPLMQMLVQIASKPKSLNEKIQEANTNTMILKIEQDAQNRHKWFTALLNTQVFQSEETRDCVKRFPNLCTAADMERLLSLGVHHKNDEEVVNIIVKCASFFDEAEISMFITRFFHEYGLKSCLRSAFTLQQLTITLNKLESSDKKEQDKDLLLLLLQDPELVLVALYKSCVMNEVLLDILRDILRSTAQVMMIENLFTRVLSKVLEENKLDAKNVKNYERLFGILAETSKRVNREFLIPLIKECLREGKYGELCYGFQIYTKNHNTLMPDDCSDLIELSFSILETCRWRIFDFASDKAVACEEAVNTLVECRTVGYRDVKGETVSQIQHITNKYYLSSLREGRNLDFVEYVCPNLCLDDHSNSVAYLIKLLPICTVSEWYFLVNALLKKYPCAKVVEVIIDTLIIVSQVTQTQRENDNGCIINGLKYCIQNFGLIIKDIILRIASNKTNVVLIKSVCRLLREIPSEVVNIEGMSLVTLLPDETLKGLTQDESFLSILMSMNGSEISRVIAKKMLE